MTSGLAIRRERRHLQQQGGTVYPERNRRLCLGIARWSAANAEDAWIKSVSRSGLRFRTAFERHRRHFVARAVAVILSLAVGAPVAAQDRFLGKQDILLFSFGLRVEPARQV